MARQSTHNASILLLVFACAAASAQPQREPGPRDTQARAEVEAVAASLQSGNYQTLWQLLAASSDNTSRSYLIHELGRLAIPARPLIDHLLTEEDASIRRALILALGAFSADQLPAVERQTLLPVLLDWYRNDPDAGVHSAIDWLLRHGRYGAQPRPLDWNQRDTLAAIDRELAETPPGQRRWYVNAQGQTLALLPGSVEFRMGAPPDETERVPGPDSPEESLRRQRIPRSFAIGTREVTRREFQEFLDANPDIRARFTYDGDPGRMASVLETFSPDAASPQIAVTWYEAAMYCNWLSLRDGLPESEWVYPSEPGGIGDGMDLPPDYLSRSGYRLPTEAEWEYAARANSTTPRFFGEGSTLLGEYAWYSRNPPGSKSAPPDPDDPQHTWPVGQLKPNDFGLFDVYGNVWEWTLDRMQQSFPAAGVDVEDTILQVTDAVARSRRGGAFPYGAAWQRSANRDTVNAFPNLRRDNVGFRIARTYPD